MAKYASRNVELPYRVSVTDQAYWTYEPHVAAGVTMPMLEGANVVGLTRPLLESVKLLGKPIRLRFDRYNAAHPDCCW